MLSSIICAYTHNCLIVLSQSENVKRIDVVGRVSFKLKTLTENRPKLQSDKNPASRISAEKNESAEFSLPPKYQSVGSNPLQLHIMDPSEFPSVSSLA